MSRCFSCGGQMVPANLPGARAEAVSQSEDPDDGKDVEENEPHRHVMTSLHSIPSHPRSQTGE